jgi:ribosome biogenesis GTPase / thiamine phosphate phosphatase
LSATPVLHAYGYNDRVPPFGDDGLETGRVARVDRGWITVATEAGLVRVVADRHALTTGDWIGLRWSPAPSIEAVAPRWSLLERSAADRTSVSQPLAANVDVVLLTVGLDRGLNLRRLDRLLTLAWASGATPAVVLTKADLDSDVAAAVAAVGRAAVGVEVIATSVEDGRGLAEVAALVPSGTTAVLLGESGAGKSSLVNRLAGARTEVGAVREVDHKGRHTTRARELIPVGDGGVLLDTPGIRGVGLAGGEAAGLERAFGDIVELAGGCRFRDCGHGAEPGCAVRAAVEDGTLGADRLAAYHSLAAEVARAAQRADRGAHRAQTRRAGRAHKQILDHQRRWRGDG